MRKIVIKAFAKINWALDVVGKRQDGYHNVEMVMQSVNLYDILTIEEKAEDDIEIICNCDCIPLDSNNIAYKSARLIKETYGIVKGVKIDLHKNIPVAAGLAGGSADAAAVFAGLNRMWNLGIKLRELMSVSARIGSDIPFCILGGTALAKGIGDELVSLPPAEGIWMVLVTPDFHVSTAHIYRSLDLSKITVRPCIQGMVECLEKRDLNGIADHMKNVLEQVTLSMYPQINLIKEDMMKQGALGCCMSGSGPTVYGIFPDEDSARKGYNVLKERYSRCFVVDTKACGVEIIEEVL
ncbi:MAG: 4-(cytidine 5'-diphospho)-2-C-methyl-D-erythritol kinase [Clostridiales bacterium]|nr:4-(cytidine 5'-diphospho)-2-C-methyl-D-erythritol kinase [Clostridiales bacterium]